MGKALAVIGVTCTLGGCLWEHNVDRRPARLQLGFNTRHVTSEVPLAPAVGTARTTTEPQSPTETISATGVTGSAQFTMAMRNSIYLGGEVEAGPMQHEGSFFGGAYGVVGTERNTDRGSLSVELIAGRRWLRAGLGAEDVPSLALEPRVRGQLWLGPQVTLGAVLGANAVPGETGWMAGIYLGVYSNEKNGAK